MTLENKHGSQSSFIYRQKIKPGFLKRESPAALDCCEIRLDDRNSSFIQVFFTL